MKSDPAQLKLKKEMVELQTENAAMRSENRKLQRKIAKLETEKFSLHNEVAALKKQLKHVGTPDLGEALRRISERALESKT